MTQGDSSLMASTHRNGSIPFRRNWAVAESRPDSRRDDRSSWQERMGLTIEEALQLPGLSGTSVAAGAAGLHRVVRHMVVDDPADPLAAAGPDVLVVLGARLPPADPVRSPWTPLSILGEFRHTRACDAPHRFVTWFASLAGL